MRSVVIPYNPAEPCHREARAATTETCSYMFTTLEVLVEYPTQHAGRLSNGVLNPCGTLAWPQPFFGETGLAGWGLGFRV